MPGGYDFMPIDIYRAQADRFQVIDGKLMPSLSSIAGLGLNAAEGCGIRGQGRPVPFQGRFPCPHQGQQDHLRPDE